MDARDHSIIAQVSIKAGAQLFEGTGNITAALSAAAEFYHWIVELSQQSSAPQGGGVATTPAAPLPAPNETFPPACPDCGGPMWDNRAGKRNPKAPDAKCKNKGCGKGVWLTPYQP